MLLCILVFFLSTLFLKGIETMKHHLLAYATAALDASAGNVQVAAVSDQVFSRANSNFQVPEPLQMLWSYFGGVGLARVRFNTGSLRSKGFPQLYPFSVTVLPAANAPISDWRNNPIMLRKEEDLRIEVTNGAANTVVGVIAVTNEMSQVYNVNDRDLRWLRWTSSVTGVLNSWSNLGTITFEDTLEAGNYNVYGLTIVEAATIAGRLVFADQKYRPGALGHAAVNDFPPYIFNAGLGIWGSFNTYAFPQLETFNSAAGATTPSGFMLVGKA